MLLQIGSKGADVKTVQRKLRVTVDGVYGAQTKAAVRKYQAKKGLLPDGIVGPQTWSALQGHPVKVIVPASSSLAQRAYRVALSLVGVMEVGGNNAGPMVTRVIRENGGVGPEPWCGDFQAYCYRHAGSKAVTRSWASVRLLRGLSGVKVISVPARGDLVRYTFDHVGMFSRDLGGGQIETIEGNTGRSGAVSDSSTGGDGVYIKHRPKSLVRDYLRVTR